jgi:hypothetical protein
MEEPVDSIFTMKIELESFSEMFVPIYQAIGHFSQKTVVLNIIKSSRNQSQGC